MSDLFTENNLEEILLSILFVAGEGVDINFIAEKLEIDSKKIKKSVDKLVERFSGKSGIHVIKYNNKKIKKYVKNKENFRGCYIHIPKGENLDEKEVNDSLVKIDKYLKKYFKDEEIIYYTESWLLSPELKEVLSLSSNIIKFQSKFDIVEYEENIKDLFIGTPYYGFVDNAMGFLNEVKQGASIADKRKLDEFYNEVCGYYGISSDWPSFNKAKEDFIEIICQLP